MKRSTGSEMATYRVDRFNGSTPIPVRAPRRWRRMEGKTVQFGISLLEDQLEALDRLAARSRMSRSEILRDLLGQALDEVDFSPLIRKAWQQAVEELSGEIQAHLALYRSTREALKEFDEQTAKLQTEKDRMAAEISHALKNGDPGAVVEARRKLAEIDDQLVAVQEIAEEFRARLASLQNERQQLEIRISLRAASYLQENFEPVWTALEDSARRLGLFLDAVGDVVDRLWGTDLRDAQDLRRLFLLGLLRRCGDFVSDPAWRAVLNQTLIVNNPTDFDRADSLCARLDRAFGCRNRPWPEVVGLFEQTAAEAEKVTGPN